MITSNVRPWAVLLVVLIAAGLAPARAGAAGWTPSVSVTGGRAHSISVAMGPRGDAAVAWRLPDSSIHAAVRPAGGAWGAPETVAPSSAPVFASTFLAVGPNGEVAVAALDSPQGGPGSGAPLRVFTRSPGGGFAAEPDVEPASNWAELAYMQDGTLVVAGNAAPTGGSDSFLAIKSPGSPLRALGTVTPGDVGSVSVRPWRDRALLVWSHFEPLTNTMSRARLQARTLAPDGEAGPVRTWDALDAPWIPLQTPNDPFDSTEFDPVSVAADAAGGLEVAYLKIHGARAAGGPTRDDRELRVLTVPGGPDGAPTAPQALDRSAYEGTTGTVIGTPGVAVDGSGSGVAAWSLTPLGGAFTRALRVATRPAGGSYGPVAELLSGPGELGGLAPVDGGGLMLVTSIGGGARSALSPPGGAFGAFAALPLPVTSYGLQSAGSGTGEAVAVALYGESLQATIYDRNYQPPPPAAGAPRISRLRVTRRFAFERPRRGRRVKVGGRITWRLSGPGRVVFTVQRLRTGERRGGKCRAVRRRHRGRRRCTLVSSLGRFTRAAAAAGPRRTAVPRRVGRSRLRPGRYRLLALPLAPTGNASSPAAQARFTVVSAR